MKHLLSHAAAVVTVASLCLGGCASRENDPGNAALMKRFRHADKNGDGRVSRDEFADFMIAEAFAAYDKKGDGYVTLAEFVEGGGTPKTFRKIDRSGGGKVTLADFQACKVVPTRKMVYPTMPGTGIRDYSRGAVGVVE